MFNVFPKVNKHFLLLLFNIIPKILDLSNDFYDNVRSMFIYLFLILDVVRDSKVSSPQRLMCLFTIPFSSADIIESWQWSEG